MEAISTGGEAFLRQLLTGLGPMFLVSLLLFMCIRLTQRFLAQGLGWKFVFYWTGWLGTPIHELSHVIVGKLCGIKIVEVKLYSPDERTGVLGYVKDVAPKLELKELHKVIGTFLMGIAPLFGGMAVITLAFVWLVYPAADGRYHGEVADFMAVAADGGVRDIAEGYYELMHSIYVQLFSEGLNRWQSWVFLYAALAIGAHLAPSNADLQGGLVGFLVLCAAALVANVIATAAGADTLGFAGQLAEIVAPMTALLVFTLALNVVNLALAMAITGSKKLLGARSG